jgi:hypothetical protein
MAPYKEKVEFEPKRKHNFIRTTCIWLTGLFASFVGGAIFTFFIQQHLLTECIKGTKNVILCKNGMANNYDLGLWIGLAAMAAFICVRLWFGRK